MVKLKCLFVVTVCIAGLGWGEVAVRASVAQLVPILATAQDEALARADALARQIIDLYRQGRYREATPLAQEVLSILEAALGETHPTVAISLLNLAELYKQQGKYTTALPLLERALSIQEASFGANHPTVATGLNNLAELYVARGQYANALPLLTRALSIQEAALRADHPDIAQSLNNLAAVYQAQGDYKVALPLYERALLIREAAFGPDHPAVAFSLNNLAGLLQAQAEYAAALPLYERALSILEAALGATHPTVAIGINNLATLYRTQGNYTAALPLYERALAINEAALGAGHPTTANSLSNLADLYQAQGNYTAALPLHEQALAVKEATLGEEHPAVATSLNNLALLYQSQGNYIAALPLYERAITINQTVFDQNHPVVAQSLNNLAELYRTQGSYTAALPLYERALVINEAAFGPDHPEVAASLNNLALLYQKQGNYGAAFPLYERAIAINEAALGSDHATVATFLSNLAGLHQIQSDYTAAIPLYERALAIRKATLGSGHPDMANGLNNLALLYWAQQESGQAIALLTQSSEIEEQNLADMLLAASEARRQRYINTLSGKTGISVSLNLKAAPTNADAIQLALSTVLRRKSRVLDAVANTLQQLRAQLTSADRALLDELEALRSQLARLRFGGLGGRTVAQYQAEVSQLEARAEAIEEKLARSSKAFQVETEPISTAAVQALIPADAALVEFVRYAPFDAQSLASAWETPRYAAYVLTQAGTLQAIDLGEAAPLDQLVAEFQVALRDRSSTVKTIARRLDKQLMAPIRPFLAGKTHLLLSPDGQLNLIPFEALVDEDDRYLIESYQTSYLTSGRDLLKLQLETPSQQPPAILANPNFGEIAEAKTTAHNSRSVDAESLTFGPLPGTAEEAEAIAPLLPNAQIYTQNQATENSLKQLQSPSILHIATHGFFLPDVDFIPAADTGNQRSGAIDIIDDETPVQVTPSNLENPLMRSGLALAGANARSSGEEDGIFTALEASGLNLQGTQLVVLSACETGAGTVSNGEGVYGLRRAFAIAGAESQLMSLWQVDDYGTSELMRLYYQNLMEKGQGRSEALRNAQLEMMNTGTYTHPYYWSAFIFSGDWRPLAKESP